MIGSKESQSRNGALERWMIPGLYLLALIVRIIYLNQIDAMPTFTWPAMDEKYHLYLVGLIHSPAGLPAEPFFRAPLYPYFLAAVYTLTDQAIYWTRFIQIVLGAFLPLIVLALGHRLFERRVAWTAAIVTAVYPTFIYYDASLLITFLMTLLTTLLIWQLYRTQDRPNWSNFVISGLLLGVAGLARPNILLLGPFLLIWVALELRPRLGWTKALLGYVVIGVCAAAVIAPVTVRNYQVSGEFVPIAWQGGYNFYIGNNVEANGWSAVAPGIDQSWEGGYRESIALAEQAAGKRLSKGEVSDYWWKRGWDDITGHLGHWLGLEIRKLRLIFQGYEIPNNQSLYMVNEYSGLMSILMWRGGVKFPFGIIAPLAIIGLALSLRDWRRFLLAYLLIGSYLITLLLFFICARFRQPILPLFILFAMLALIRLIDLFRRRDYRTAGVILAVFVLLAVESNHSLLGLDDKRMTAEGYLMQGNAYLEDNRVNAAAGEYKKAVAVDPTLARALNNLGMLAARRGDVTTARRYFLDATKQAPNDVEALSNLASTFIETNQAELAIPLLERARSINIANPITHLKLAAAYTAVGQLDKALASAKETLRFAPNNQQAVRLIQHIESLRNAPESSGR